MRLVITLTNDIIKKYKNITSFRMDERMIYLSGEWDEDISEDQLLITHTKVFDAFYVSTIKKLEMGQ